MRIGAIAPVASGRPSPVERAARVEAALVAPVRRAEIAPQRPFATVLQLVAEERRARRVIRVIEVLSAPGIDKPTRFSL